ncbi:MAG: histidine--tRNA ligase [Candidatus Micrarchaeota archaeon]|nr:MAG: histidine--tRNA ligase [Candidatus Micrarchaeota archaeon]
MAAIQQPRGVRDLDLDEALFRSIIISDIERVYRRYGFNIMETAYLESLSLIKERTIGDDNIKDIIKVEGEDSFLRFDQTLSLARYVATNNSIPMPLKRYSIGRVWRNDEPQRMRYREFTQADIDIVGSDSIYSDAEVISCLYEALSTIGVKPIVKLNDRKIYDLLLDKLNIKDMKTRLDALRVIDKLGKISKEDAADRLSKLNIGSDTVNEILNFALYEGDNEKKLTYIADVTGEASAKRLKELIDILKGYGLLNNSIEIDLSIIRGLDYYTGVIFEIKDPRESLTVAAGGRYDKLVSVYANRDVPMVGGSIGVDRVEAILFDKRLNKLKTLTNVYIAFINDNNYRYALDLLNYLRSKGINADINLNKRNITHQIEYASSLKIRYIVIIGNDEQSASKYRLKDLESGEEKLLTREELLNELVNAK